MGYMTVRLWRAARDGDVSKLKVLLLEPECNALAKDYLGWTALMHAARYGKASCVSLLLPVSEPLICDWGGMTALMWAASSGHTSCVQLLLPVSDPLFTRQDGRTASDLASKGNHDQVAKMIDAYALAQKEKMALHSVIAAGALQKRSSRRV